MHGLYPPGARVVRYEDAGHFVSEEKPDELNHEIEMLLAARSG